MRTIPALAIGLILLCHVAAQAQQPPSDMSGTFTAGGLCAFDVIFDVTGKGSTIVLPGGATIMTSPGLTATLTNEDEPTNQVTLNVTGSITRTDLGGGRTEAIMTGRNLFSDPDVGFVLLIGHWRAVTGSGGTLVEDLEGTG